MARSRGQPETRISARVIVVDVRVKHRIDGSRQLSYRVEIQLLSTGQYFRAYMSHEHLLLIPDGLEKLGQYREHHKIQDEHKIRFYLVQGPLESYRVLWRQFPINEYKDLTFLARMERMDLWQSGVDYDRAYGSWFRLGDFREGPRASSRDGNGRGPRTQHWILYWDASH